MSLRTAVAAQSKTQGPKCVVGIIRDGLKGKALEELDELLADRDTKAAPLSRAMTAEYGRKVADQAVYKHRNGVCSCGAR